MAGLGLMAWSCGCSAKDVQACVSALARVGARGGSLACPCVFVSSTGASSIWNGSRAFESLCFKMVWDVEMAYQSVQVRFRCLMEWMDVNKGIIGDALSG